MDFHLIRFQSAQVKGVKGMVCKSHGGGKGKGYSLVLCWWKPPRLPVPHTEVAGSTHVQLLACEWEDREKRREFLTAKAWPCLCQAGNVLVVQRDTEDDGERHFYVTAVRGSKGESRHHGPLEEGQERVTESSYWKTTGKGILKQ